MRVGGPDVRRSAGTDNPSMSNTSADFHDPRPILVGLDGSENAEKAMWWAVDIAVASERSVRLLASYALPVIMGIGASAGYMPPVLSSEDVHEADMKHRALLDSMKDKIVAANPSLKVEVFLEQGSPALALLKAAEDCSMIVLGTRGIGGAHALLMGSTSYAVAHRAKCPVALVPETSDRSGAGKVIAGVDGSTNAMTAANWAADLACAVRRPLELVTAWHYPYAVMAPEMGPMSAPDIEELRLAMLRDAKSLVGRVKDRIIAEHKVAPSIEVNLYEGSATDSLVESSQPSDIVVVGSRSHSVLASVLLGSTALGVAHRSKGPVVIVH